MSFCDCSPPGASVHGILQAVLSYKTVSTKYKPMTVTVFPGETSGKEPACQDIKDEGSIPGLGRTLGRGMATHSSILAWRILWTEEPGGL